MLSDTENIDIMLGGNVLKREESESSNFADCLIVRVMILQKIRTLTLTLTRVNLKIELMPKIVKV